MTDEIDWKRVCRVYIEHVSTWEGTDFLSHGVSGLSDAEYAALKALADDVWGEPGALDTTARGM